MPPISLIWPHFVRSEEEEVQETEAAAGKAGTEKKGYVGIHATGFKELMLKPELLQAIADCGFEHPSEGEDALAHFVAMLKFAPCSFTIAPYRSPTRMHPARNSRYGRPLPGEIRHGKDGCVRPLDPAATRSQAWRGVCYRLVPHARARLPGA